MEKMIKTLNYLHQEGNQDYQDRIPIATQENIKEVGNAILGYKETTNEFITNIINKIALTEVFSASPRSVFGEFIGQDLMYGDTIESIFVNIVKSQEFSGEHLKDGDSIDPYKVSKPKVEVVYHKIDRRLEYQITVQDDMIKNGFKSSSAFDDFINSLITSLEKSVERDLYLDGLELLNRDGTDGNTNIYGLKQDLGEFTDKKEMAKTINETLIDHITYLPFSNKKYNALGVETNTPKDDIVVFIRADIKNLIDQEVLSNVFNPNKLTTNVKHVLIDNFIDPKQVISIIDRKALKINHSLRKTTNQYNARGLYTNYFSHIHRLVSYNPFADAIKITALLKDE